jgi:hypothetical protein
MGGVVKVPFVFSYVEYCDMDFAMALHVLLLTNTKGVFPTEGFCLGVYFLVFTRQCVRLVVFEVLLCSLKGRWYERLTPLAELPLASAYHVCRCGELYVRKIYILIMIKGYNIWNQATMLNVWIKAHPELLRVILFIDEASFTRDGINNSRNLHTWSHDNPHETSVTKF